MKLKAPQTLLVWKEFWSSSLETKRTNWTTIHDPTYEIHDIFRKFESSKPFIFDKSHCSTYFSRLKTISTIRIIYQKFDKNLRFVLDSSRNIQTVFHQQNLFSSIAIDLDYSNDIVYILRARNTLEIVYAREISSDRNWFQALERRIKS